MSNEAKGTGWEGSETLPFSPRRLPPIPAGPLQASNPHPHPVPPLFRTSQFFSPTFLFFQEALLDNRSHQGLPPGSPVPGFHTPSPDLTVMLRSVLLPPSLEHRPNT